MRKILLLLFIISSIISAQWVRTGTKDISLYRAADSLIVNWAKSNLDTTNRWAPKGSYQASGTYLVPNDSTANRTFSDLKYLKNADSTSNRTFSDLKYLKNADSTSNRTFSDLKYLKNADSTTFRTASNVYYAPKIGSANITTLGTITTGTWNGSVIDTSYLAAIRQVTAKTMLSATRYNTYDIQLSADTLTRSLSFATDADRIADSVLMATKLFIVDSAKVAAGYGVDVAYSSHTATVTVDTTNEIATLFDVSQKINITDSTIVGVGYGLDRTVSDNTQTITVDTTNEIATLYDVSQVSGGSNATKAVLVDTLNNTGVTSSINFASNIVTMAASIVDSTKTGVANDQYMKEWQYRITTVDTIRDYTIDSIAHELTFALDAASLYEFEYQLYFVTNDAGNATGVEVLATCASAPTTISGIFAGALNAGIGAGLMSHDVQTSNADTVRTVSSFAGTTPMVHTYVGRILTNAATALNFSFQAEEVADKYATLKRGSYGKIRKLYP